MQIDFFIYLMYELHQFTPFKITLCHYSTSKLVIFQYSRVRIITIFWESQMDYKPKIDFNRICTGMPALVG